MPSGWGRVTMTQRGIRSRTSSCDAPSETWFPTNVSSSAPVRSTLARNRRRSHPPYVVSLTSDTAASSVSWKAPDEPVNGDHELSVSCSMSEGFSYRRVTTSAEALVDGRHVTQDLGRWLHGGRLEVLGRADDIIITGGVNVPAALVERVLGGYPGVASCAVVGRADAEWGERVVAVVQPVDWSDVPTLANLRDFAGDWLDASSLPREVVALPLLPLLSSGKPDKEAVEALLRDRDGI